VNRTMSSRYRGLLARPIIVTPQTSDEELVLAFHKRMLALYELFKIDPEDKHAGRRLLHALMRRHVPGCRVKPQTAAGIENKNKRPGRPAALDVVQRVKLQNRMDLLIATGIRKPAYQLGSDPDFKGLNPETLRRTYARDRSKYKKYKDPIVGIAKEFISDVSAKLKPQEPNGAFGFLEPVKTRAKKTV
jgi:hypothetical protein